MKPREQIPAPSTASGMTLVEVMVAMGLGVMVLAFVAVLFVSSLSNFAGLGNYAALTGQSRYSLDSMSREIRECTQLLGLQTNGTIRWLLLTNAYQGSTIRYTWDVATGTVTCEKPGQPAQVCLTGCDDWRFSCYQRTPGASWRFTPTTDPKLCKVINMTWKCSRSILGRKINTETVVTSQIVLRNKP